MPSPWPALALARRCDGPRRVPLTLRADGVVAALGSVAVTDLDALRAFDDAVAIIAADAAVEIRLPRARRDARLAEIHRALRAEGRIHAWRDEAYPLRDLQGGVHGVVERASSRFWGLLTVGAHCNGYLADAAGRPTHLWIARRSYQKPTDPGRLDNLVGGGVPLGQTPREAVLREGWEEAGLAPAQMQGLRAGGLIELACDVPEGRQLEWLHVFDLCLPADFRPRNTDGEVEEHLLMPVAEALARAAAGEQTTDAALATLDFALRHDLLGEAAPALAAALDRLRPVAQHHSN